MKGDESTEVSSLCSSYKLGKEFGLDLEVEKVCRILIAPIDCFKVKMNGFLGLDFRSDERSLLFRWEGNFFKRSMFV